LERAIDGDTTLRHLTATHKATGGVRAQYSSAPRGLPRRLSSISRAKCVRNSLKRGAVRTLALVAEASPRRLSCISSKLARCRLASSKAKPPSSTSISGQISCLYASRAQRHTLIILRSTVSARGSAQRRVGAKFTSASTLYLSLVQQESVRAGLGPRHRLWMRLQASMLLLLLLVLRSPSDG
jgi:hypothetical protein